MAKKKIYDDGGTVVTAEETVAVKKETPNVEEAKSEGIMNLKLSDIADAFAGYLIPQINFMEMGEGHCAICGKETNSEMRTVCMECFKKYKHELYAALKTACGDERVDINA